MMYFLEAGAEFIVRRNRIKTRSVELSVRCHGEGISRIEEYIIGFRIAQNLLHVRPIDWGKEHIDGGRLGLRLPASEIASSSSAYSSESLRSIAGCNSLRSIAISRHLLSNSAGNLSM
jgi:hypothetical protein